MMSSNNQAFRQWKRFSDFKLLAEYAKISDLRESVGAWRRVQQVTGGGHNAVLFFSMVYYLGVDNISEVKPRERRGPLQ